jgi:hypothetical protein
MTNNVYAGVAPVVPPELKVAKQAACVRFRDELMAYRMMLESMEGDHRHVSSVSMIQPTLLMSLFVIGALNGLTPLTKPDSIESMQMHIYKLGYVRGVRRMTRASHPALRCNKWSREDKKGEDRRDAARDRTSEEPVRKKTRNEVRAAKKKQRNDGASTGSGSSTEIKDAAAMVCYACGDKGHALRECTKVEEGAKESITEGKFQEWKEARKDKKDEKEIGTLAQVQGADRYHVYEVLLAKAEQSLLCIADTGADISALSETFVNKIKNPPVVKYEPLAEPAHLQLARENYEDKSMSLVQIAWVTMPIVVCLHCGPLRVPDWHFAVVRGRMEGGILGREFLTQILGLDLKVLFEKARQTRSAKGSESLVEHASVRKSPFPILASGASIRRSRQTTSTVC